MERERHASSSSASPADIPLPRQLSNVRDQGLPKAVPWIGGLDRSKLGSHLTKEIIALAFA